MNTSFKALIKSILAFTLLFVLFLQGCQTSGHADILPGRKQAEPPNPTATVSSVVVPTQEETFQAEEHIPLATNTPVAPEPLRFTFPTAVNDPVSGWRPPLYPVPWEPTQNDHFYFMRPIGADEVNWPLARYRYGGVFFEDVVHSGIDIPVDVGTPVYAVGPGKVVWAGYGLFFLKEEFQDPYGLAIAIEHDFGYENNPIYTVYGHMDRILAYRGQHVESGQIIGYSGETGNVTGPHLHFEVRLKDNRMYGSRNPELWLSPPQGWGILAGRVMNDAAGLQYKKTVHLRNKETNQHWYVITYGKGGVNPDPYYKENMVIGDLPAGMYRVFIEHDADTFGTDIEIKPGMVSYFRFVGRFGFRVGLPPTPAPEFLPPDVTPSATP